jgi:hypothetical protein
MKVDEDEDGGKIVLLLSAPLLDLALGTSTSI